METQTDAARRSVQLAVIRVDGSWCILVNGERVGRFEGQSDAARCAVEIARMTREEGQPVEVLLQGDFGEVRTIPTSAVPLGVAA